MKPFVINRYGRIVFPFNFVPTFDFSVFDSLEQFSAVIRRDFEDKAPAESDIVSRVVGGGYKTRYELLRDLASTLSWANRSGITLYQNRPTRWRDVPRFRDEVLLSVFKATDMSELSAAVDAGYRSLGTTWDEGVEDKVFRILFDVFRHRKWAAAELPAIKPTVAEALANPRNLTWTLLAYDPDYPGYSWQDIVECHHTVPELEALLRQTMVLHNEYRWDRGKLRLTEVGKLDGDDWVVVFTPRGEDAADFIRRVRAGHRQRPSRPTPAVSERPLTPYPPIEVRKRFAVMPRLASVATWLSGQLGIFQTHASCDIVAACAGLPYGLAEAIRLLQEVERPVLVVCGEKFSDKIGTVRTSRMIFGDGAAALVVGPAERGAPPDVEVFQTYASGPMSEVDSIVWPNPEFDNNITVYGPEVRKLVKRYLGQMLSELRALPHPDGGAGSLMDAIDLTVPHQANRTMVERIAADAGLAPERCYFNIETVANTSSASIPIALHDAIRGGVIDRPLRVFAPGFGAGAVGGYVVMKVDPAIAA